MVNATVENDPISVELGSSESVSVPPGETWYVEILMISTSTGNNTEFTINGDIVSRRGSSDSPMSRMTATLVAGDTFATPTGSAYLTGWVVSS